MHRYAIGQAIGLPLQGKGALGAQAFELFRGYTDGIFALGLGRTGDHAPGDVHVQALQFRARRIDEGIFSGT
ncbi:hypothetical protein D3C79_672750 [compost metagenome]